MAGGGFERPPPWAIVTMIVSAAALIVVGILYLNRPAPPEATAAPSASAARTSALVVPPPATSSAPIPAPIPAREPPTSIDVPADPRLLIVGDSYTAGVGAQSPETSFARLAAQELGWAAATAGEAGTGFLAAGPDGNRAYRDRLLEVDVEAPPDVIVVQGGLNDRGRAGDLTAAAVDALQAAQGRFPEAAIVLMGPVDPNPPDPGVRAVAHQLRAAAAQVGVPFIDASGWLGVDTIAQYADGDGLHVNQAGHTYLGGRLAEAVRSLIG